MNPAFLEAWHDYVNSHDEHKLWSMLHPDAVFESPVVHTPQRGREVTFKYLKAAFVVLGGPGFRYVGSWQNANGVVLEFENEIQGIRLNGVDMITWNAVGQITHFKVMVRPLKAINMLHQMMGAQLMQG
jgi:hypothetical protein